MAVEDSEILQFLWNWVKENYVQLIVATIIIIISVVLLITASRYLHRLEERGKLTENYRKILIRVVRSMFSAILILSFLMVFNITVGAITGAIALLGGTIIGFAAINTLGNAIAGLIIMISKPIHIGDRLFFKEQYADVISIEIIYTKLQTLGKSVIIIPNQELLRLEIINYSLNVELRRACSITVDFSTDDKVVETTLLEAIEGIEGILEQPKPTVSIKNFKDNGVEYGLNYSIKDMQEMFSIASNLRRNILEKAKKYNIDLRTPHLVQNLQK